MKIKPLQTTNYIVSLLMLLDRKQKTSIMLNCLVLNLAKSSNLRNEMSQRSVISRDVKNDFTNT